MVEQLWTLLAPGVAAGEPKPSSFPQPHRRDTGYDCQKRDAMGATRGDCSETGDGERNSSDLAQAWALAKCDDGERDGEHWL